MFLPTMANTLQQYSTPPPFFLTDYTIRKRKKILALCFLMDSDGEFTVLHFFLTFGTSIVCLEIAIYHIQ